MYRGQDVKNLGDVKEARHSGSCKDYLMAPLKSVMGSEAGHVSRPDPEGPFRPSRGIWQSSK